MVWEPRSRLLLVLVVVEGLSSVFGFIGGIPLTIDPSGRLLNMPLSYLSSFPLPLHDFLLPGLWLLLGYGVGLSATAFLLWSRRPFAWDVAMALGVIWLGWVTFQVIFIGPVPIVTVWLVPQIVAVLLLLSPAVRGSLH